MFLKVPKNAEKSGVLCRLIYILLYILLIFTGRCCIISFVKLYTFIIFTYVTHRASVRLFGFP